MKKSICAFLAFFLIIVVSFNNASPSFAACSLDSIPPFAAACPSVDWTNKQSTTGICHQVTNLGDPDVTWAYTVGEGNWKKLEPQRCVFNWKELDEAVAKAKCAGKKIWIQVLTDDPSGTIPQWALDAGMHQFPGEYSGKYCGVPPITTDTTVCTGKDAAGHDIPPGCCQRGKPVQWDPKYLEFLQEILTAMANRYDNSSGNNDAIEAILMMSGGHYGEMSLSGSLINIRRAYLQEMSRVTGVSEADLVLLQTPNPPWPSGVNRIPPPINNPKYLFDKYFVLNVFKLIDMYATTFRNKPVVLQLGTTSMWPADQDSRFVAMNPMYYAMTTKNYGSHVWFKQNGLGNWNRYGTPGVDDVYNGMFSKYVKPNGTPETRFVREIGHREQMCFKGIETPVPNARLDCVRPNSNPPDVGYNACLYNKDVIEDTIGRGHVSAICFQSNFFNDKLHYPCIFNFPNLRARMLGVPVPPSPTPGPTPPPGPTTPPIVPVTPPPVDPWEYLPPGPGGGAENRPLNGVGDFLGLGINIVLGIALGIALIAIILSGIKLITSKGDPKAKAAAQQAFTYAVVAFILTIGAFTLKEIIFNVVGGDYGDLRNATPHF